MATGKSNRQPKNFQDLTGQRFGKLTVLRREENDPRSGSCWLCQCDCGKETTVKAYSLKNGHTRSCGCVHTPRPNRFGVSRPVHHQRSRPEWTIWRGMISRCYCPTCSNYPYYGGRGTTVCKAWREDFLAFLSDIGERPTPKHMIDRIDGSGNYTCGHCDECLSLSAPKNCRWATRQTQMQNRSCSRHITFNGETMVLAEWARRTGITRETITRRLNLGWSADRALTTPVHKTATIH